MTDDYLGLLLAESCILFLNWYNYRPIIFWETAPRRVLSVGNILRYRAKQWE
jgi:hypothetical protein